MLKNSGYSGAYRDENISVSVLLENPLEHNLEATALVFSLALRARNDDTPKLDDFTFYLMNETNRLYNAQFTPYIKPVIEKDQNDDEPVRRPVGLICTGFKHDFLFQQLRIAFYYRPYDTINVIKLQH